MKKKFTRFLSCVLVVVLLFGNVLQAEGISNQDDIVYITYHSGMPDGLSYTKAYSSEECIDGIVDVEEIFKFYSLYKNQVFIGWETDENIRMIDEDFLLLEDGKKNYDLYAEWCDVVLGHNEIFCFADYEKRYNMTPSDYSAMLSNYLRNYFCTPMPSLLINLVLSTFPLWKFNCCFGFTLSIALQHLGMIDLLSEQGVEDVYSLEETDELWSHLHYYLAQCVSNILFMNKSLVPGSEIYKKNTEAMFNAVKSGELVMLCAINRERFALFHSVLLCGAYDDEYGNHVIIVYDPSHPDRYSKGEGKMIISPDFSELYCQAYKGTLDSFGWYSDFSQFDSFKIDRTGSSDAWKTAFQNHIKFYYGRIIKGIF